MGVLFKIGDAIALLFLAGALVMSYFLILSGGRSGGVLKNFYWLEANTTGFNNAPDTTRWFNYDFCAWANNNLHNCSHKAPAKPFSPRDNFGASPLMPSSFLNNRNAYYYLSRVGWAMLLIAVFFETVGLFTHLWSLFSKGKLGRISSITNTVFHWCALFFITLAACLLTGCHAKAKKAFHSENRHAKMGVKNFAFLWTTVFLLLLTSVWSIVSTILKKRESRNTTNYYSTGGAVAAVPDRDIQDDELGYANTTDATTTGKTEEDDNNVNNSYTEYNVVEPAETSQLPRNPNIVSPPATTTAATNTNTTPAKNKLFKKIRKNDHEVNTTGNNNNETILTTTKEEEEYEIQP